MDHSPKWTTLINQEKATEAEHELQIHNWMQDDMGLDLAENVTVLGTIVIPLGTIVIPPEHSNYCYSITMDLVKMWFSRCILSCRMPWASSSPRKSR